MIRLLLLISILVNVVFSFVLFFKSEPKTHNPAESSSQAEKYPFISKRVFVENPNDLLINFVDLRTQIRAYLADKGDSVSLYFEYLPTGTSIGIREKDQTRLASLSKIPTVMAIYKKISRGELSEDQTLTLEKKFINKQFGTLWEKGIGYKLSIKDAIGLAITESDNTAHNMLLSNLTTEEINDVYEYLDIPFNFEENYPIISAKNYTSILRSLYLSTYLSFEYSNEIIEIMTHTIYKDRLAAGVPKDIPVAHKIGVYESEHSEEESTYSDCGIIYVPLRPYLLCIMVVGTNTQALEYMSGLSKVIYSFVSSQDIKTTPSK